MALSRFVVTAAVTIPAGTAAAISGGFGTVGWTGALVGAGPATVWTDGMAVSSDPDAGYEVETAVTFVPGQVIYADSTGTNAACNGPQALYQAIGSANLRPYVQGQDDVGHAALGN